MAQKVRNRKKGSLIAVLFSIIVIIIIAGVFFAPPIKHYLFKQYHVGGYVRENMTPGQNATFQDGSKITVTAINIAGSIEETSASFDVYDSYGNFYHKCLFMTFNDECGLPGGVISPIGFNASPKSVTISSDIPFHDDTVPNLTVVRGWHTPASPTTSTEIFFSAEVSGNADYGQTCINDTCRPMSYQGNNIWSYSTTLFAGSHKYYFVFESGGVTVYYPNNPHVNALTVTVSGVFITPSPTPTSSPPYPTPPTPTVTPVGDVAMMLFEDEELTTPINPNKFYKEAYVALATHEDISSQEKYPFYASQMKTLIFLNDQVEIHNIDQIADACITKGLTILPPPYLQDIDYLDEWDWIEQGYVYDDWHQPGANISSVRYSWFSHFTFVYKVGKIENLPVTFDNNAIYVMLLQYHNVSGTLPSLAGKRTGIYLLGAKGLNYGEGHEEPPPGGGDLKIDGEYFFQRSGDEGQLDITINSVYDGNTKLNLKNVTWENSYVDVGGTTYTSFNFEANASGGVSGFMSFPYTADSPVIIHIEAHSGDKSGWIEWTTDVPDLPIGVTTCKDYLDPEKNGIARTPVIKDLKYVQWFFCIIVRFFSGIVKGLIQIVEIVWTFIFPCSKLLENYPQLFIVGVILTLGAIAIMIASGMKGDPIFIIILIMFLATSIVGTTFVDLFCEFKSDAPGCTTDSVTDTVQKTLQLFHQREALGPGEDMNITITPTPSSGTPGTTVPDNGDDSGDTSGTSAANDEIIKTVGHFLLLFAFIYGAFRG